jgi:hypothetical protein
VRLFWLTRVLLWVRGPARFVGIILFLVDIASEEGGESAPHAGRSAAGLSMPSLSLGVPHDGEKRFARHCSGGTLLGCQVKGDFAAIRGVLAVALELAVSAMPQTHPMHAWGRCVPLRRMVWRGRLGKRGLGQWGQRAQRSLAFACRTPSPGD